MQLQHKLVFHIPEKAWRPYGYVDLKIESHLDQLLDSLKLSGYTSLYIENATGYYNARSYPEKLITIYYSNNIEKLLNIFRDWFLTNHNFYQEVMAYELDSSMYLEQLEET